MQSDAAFPALVVVIVVVVVVSYIAAEAEKHFHKLSTAITSPPRTYSITQKIWNLAPLS